LIKSAEAELGSGAGRLARFGEPDSDLQVHQNAAVEIRVERYRSITKSFGFGCILLGGFRPSALSTTNPM
jgi:hypothetical protein